MLDYLKSLIGYEKCTMGVQDTLFDIYFWNWNFKLVRGIKPKPGEHSEFFNPNAPWFSVNHLDEYMNEFFGGAIKSYSCKNFQFDILDTRVWSPHVELCIILEEFASEDERLDYYAGITAGEDFEVCANRLFNKHRDKLYR